ncbi:MAG: glycosyltransferase family 39 protein [bacterium]
MQQSFHSSFRSFLLRHRALLIMQLWAVVLLALLQWREFEPLFLPYSQDGREKNVTRDNFDKQAVELSGPWVKLDEGWGLAPGEKGSAVFDFRKHPREGATLALEIPARELADVHVAVESGGQRRELSAEELKSGRPIDLSSMVEGGKRLSISLDASASPSAAQGVAIVKSINLTLTSSVPGWLPNLPPWMAFLFLPGVLAGFGARQKWREWVTLGIGGIALLVLGVFQSSLGRNAQVLVYLFYLLVPVAWGVAISKQRVKDWQPFLLRLTLAAICVYGLALRWDALDQIKAEKLRGDATTYRLIAENMRHPFDTGLREPVQIWAVWLTEKIFAPSDWDIRLMTILLSLAVVAATGIVGTRWFSPPVGLGAALFIATNKEIIFQSVSGLRLEIYMLCLLGFLGFLFRERSSRPSWKTGVGAGVWGGLLCLQLLSALSIFTAFTILVALVKRWRWCAVAMAFALTGLMVAPHMINNYFIFGFKDPFFSVNIHVRFYRNMEFAGQPGFPTKEEFQRYSYAGKHISSAQYIFGLHTPGEVASRIYKGLYRCLFGENLMSALMGGQTSLLGLYLLGILALAVRRQWLFLCALILMELPTSFLAAGIIEFDVRLVIHHAPFVAMAVLAGLEFLALGVLAEEQARETPSISTIPASL